MGVEVMHWRMDDLSGATPIKKAHGPFVKIHQVSVASQIRIRLKNPSPAPFWDVV